MDIYDRAGHLLPRPKTVKLTGESEEPTEREVTVAIDIMLRALRYGHPFKVKRYADELSNITNEDPDVGRRMAALFVLWARFTAPNEDLAATMALYDKPESNFHDIVKAIQP